MKRKPCILVVEHDLLVRQPLAEYLRDCGYTVIEAVHTDEAVEVLASGSVPVEIVLADVSSPGKVDGFGLSRWMKEKNIPAEVILAARSKRQRQLRKTSASKVHSKKSPTTTGCFTTALSASWRRVSAPN